jgi:hypothetical protein
MAVDQILSANDISGGSSGVPGIDPNAILGAISSWFAEFIDQAGNDPMSAMAWLIAHGGWVVFLILGFYAARLLWLESRQGKYVSKLRYILLAVDIPRASEQTVKAVENMFAHLAGTHSPPTFLEKWWDGKVQDCISLEIVSIEGHVQYLVRAIVKHRDLIEASIYAQYPDAEIAEVEDYTTSVPNRYPNDTHECFAVELMTVKKPDVYPLKTYEEFEHGLTAEFKDPLAVLLEGLSRIGPGEQLWYQIIMEPVAQIAFVETAKKEIAKLAGREVLTKKPLSERALNAPFKVLETAAEIVMGSAPAEKKKEDNPFGKMLMITPGERKIIEALERKMSKIQFKCKLRFVYIAKKEVFSKAKVAGSFLGAIKQFNTNDMQAFKPESKRVSVSSTIVFFKTRRNNVRKNRFLQAYIGRSGWHGLDSVHLGVDELATLWHLPVIKYVKAPQVKKTESKKVEPPMNIPFAS